MNQKELYLKTRKMNKYMKKLNKLLSMLVVLAIVFSMTSLVVYAQNNDETENETTTEATTQEKVKTTIKITNKNKIIQKGSNNHRIEYILSGQTDCKVTFTVKDKSIATISSDGFVTGKKCGKTRITIKTDDGASDSQEITVKDNALPLNANSAQLALDNENVERIKYGTSVQKRNLEGFVITNNKNQKCKVTASSVNVRSGAGTSYAKITSLKKGAIVTRIAKNVKESDGYVWDKISFDKKTGYIATDFIKPVDNEYKTLFIDFAVHGFEDEYYRDGQALTAEANALIEYFTNNSKELGDYRLIIVPCANPDGTIAGKNNKRACSSAFGRCTAEHIDINRDFGSFKAIESRKLRDFIKECKPDIYLNIHGWLNEAIGEKTLNSIVCKQLGLGKSINNYPSQKGYIIDWVNKNLKIPATLVEYESSSSISTQKDIKMIKAIVSSSSIRNTSASSNQAFPSPVCWKNGSTAETVYKINNFSQKLGTIKAKASASCYGKSENAYIVVYSGNKVGFVKYSGGVKNPPTKSKTYKNGSTSETVYTDTGRKTAIGSLDPKESCKCLGKINGMYLVVYNVSGTSKQKCGFVKYNGI